MTTTELRAVLRLKENMNEAEKILANTILAWELERKLPINKEVGAAVATFIYRAYEQLRLANKGPDLETKEKLANALEIWTLPNVYHLPFAEGRDRAAQALEQFSRIIAFASDSFIHMNTRRHLNSEITTLTDAFGTDLSEYFLEYIVPHLSMDCVLRGSLGEFDLILDRQGSGIAWGITNTRRNLTVGFTIGDMDSLVLSPSLNTGSTTANLLQSLEAITFLAHRLPRHPAGVRDLFKIL